MNNKFQFVAEVYATIIDCFKRKLFRILNHNISDLSRCVITTSINIPNWSNFVGLWRDPETQLWLDVSRGEAKKRICDAIDCGRVEGTVGVQRMFEAVVLRS